MEVEKNSQNQIYLYHLVEKKEGCNIALPDSRNTSASETQACPCTADTSSLLGHGVSPITKAFTMMTWFF